MSSEESSSSIETMISQSSTTITMLSTYGSGSNITFPEFDERVSFFHGLLSRPQLIYRSDHDKITFNREAMYSGQHPVQHYLLESLPGKLASDFNRIVLPNARTKWEEFKDFSGINTLTLNRFGRHHQFGSEAKKPYHAVFVGQAGDATEQQNVIAAAFANSIAASLENLGHADVPVYVITWEVYEFAKRGKLENVATTKTQSLANITKGFTNASGVSTALVKKETAQGTRGFWLLKKGDTNGRYAVSCRHVWQVDSVSNQDPNLEYTYKEGTGMPKMEVAWPVHMAEINWKKDHWPANVTGIMDMISQKKRHLGYHITEADRQIARTPMAQRECSEEYQDAVRIKARSERSGLELAQVEVNIVNQKKDVQARTGGFVIWSPPIDRHPRTGYTLDMAISISYEDTHSTDALENYIILGDKISETKLMDLLNRNDSNPTCFKYPEGGKLKFKTSITPISALIHGTQVDEHGVDDNIVLKDGRSTGISVGRLSVTWGCRTLQMPNGSTKLTNELAIVSGREYEPFCSEGDSGAAVVRCVNNEAELVGMITSGSGYNREADHTWATPAEALQEEWARHGYYLP
ncbi:hypothetical protein DV736_g5968, partial [Chaetothyriales sp. CBS 134916]